MKVAEVLKQNRGESRVLVEALPADLCKSCGEYYLPDAIAERVLSLAEEAVRRGAEVENVRFAA